MLQTLVMHLYKYLEAFINIYVKRERYLMLLL